MSSHASSVVWRAWPLAPHTPRGGTCTSGRLKCTPAASASPSTAGHRSLSSGRSSTAVRGRSPKIFRPAFSNAPISTPESRLAKVGTPTSPLALRKTRS